MQIIAISTLMISISLLFTYFLLIRIYNDFSIRSIDIFPDRKTTQKLLILVSETNLENMYLIFGTLVKYSRRHNIIIKIVSFHNKTKVSKKKFDKVAKSLNIEDVEFKNYRQSASEIIVESQIKDILNSFRPNVVITTESSLGESSRLTNRIVNGIKQNYRKTKSFFLYIATFDDKQKRLFKDCLAENFYTPNFSVRLRSEMIKKYSILKKFYTKSSNFKKCSKLPLIVHVLLMKKECFYKQSR